MVDVNKTRKAPTAATKPRIGLTTILPLCGALAVGVLLAWGIIDNTSSPKQAAWEQIPAGQPYALDPPTPLTPVSAGAVKLPPMVTSTVSRTILLRIDPPPLGGNYDTDAQMQDVISPAFFSVRAGTTVRVTVENYDVAPHTFTSLAIGLNEWIPAGAAQPSRTTFTFVASSPGNDMWICAIPCDSYSMSTPGYMQGEIHVVAADWHQN